MSMPRKQGIAKPRNTTRQREVAAAAREHTRRKLLAAAGQEFRERGYAGATVKRIAERADVTVQTLYLAWGSKRSLLRAHMEEALAGPRLTPDGPLPDAVFATVAQFPQKPRAAVAHLAREFRRIADRAALGWQLYRDAAAVDAEVAADWRELQRLRQRTFNLMIGRLRADALRPELDLESATRTAWTIASPETYDLLVRHAGRTADEYEEWLATTLAAVLLPDASANSTANGMVPRRSARRPGAPGDPPASRRRRAPSPGAAAED